MHHTQGRGLTQFPQDLPPCSLKLSLGVEPGLFQIPAHRKQLHPLQIPKPTTGLYHIQSVCDPEGRVTKCQNKAPHDVPQCDTQPMPSQTAFWTHSTQVHEDYDCTLNQTNIGNNNNKFYIIQLLEEGSRFFCWNRWGRVVSEPPPGLPFPTPPPPGTPLKVIPCRERWARAR